MKIRIKQCRCSRCAYRFLLVAKWRQDDQGDNQSEASNNAKRWKDSLYSSTKERFQIESNEQIFQTLYTTQFPNRYLASFCKFADEYVTHPYIKNKVRDSFRDFFKNLVSKYPDYKYYSFNCVGSVGYVFSEILIEVANSYDMKVGKVIRSPLQDLVEYHLAQTEKI